MGVSTSMVSLGNLGLAGIWCIIRDCAQNVVGVVCGLVGICDSTKAETMALVMGGCVRKKSLGVFGSIVEGDSAVAVS